MTLATFINRLNTIREFVKRANEIDELTGTSWCESYIEPLFGVAFDGIMPEVYSDQEEDVVEHLSDIIFAPDNKYSYEDIRQFYTTYFESQTKERELD
jgi:hypothetical protein